MRRVAQLASSAAFVLAAFSSPAFAAYTTVDLSSYVNSNVAINANTFPTGSTTGNEGTGITFDIAKFGGIAGTWNSGGVPGAALTVDLTPYNISGQASFYALLNNYFGTPNADEYDVTIKTTNNDSVTYQSIGGVDTRDYNSNVFTNTIADTTTPFFDNGIGQRLDVREFDLPASFLNETLDSFTITQVHTTDAALLSGITFSDQAAVTFGVPEPLTLSLFGAGVAGVAALRRRKNAKVA